MKNQGIFSERDIFCEKNIKDIGRFDAVIGEVGAFRWSFHKQLVGEKEVMKVRALHIARVAAP